MAVYILVSGTFTDATRSDIDNSQHPQGASIDIGPHEFVE